MIPCAGCGRQTNTALCDHFNGKPMTEAKVCYAAWDGDKYVKGCGFDQAGQTERELAEHFIKERA